MLPVYFFREIRIVKIVNQLYFGQKIEKVGKFGYFCVEFVLIKNIGIKVENFKVNKCLGVGFLGPQTVKTRRSTKIVLVI